MQENYFFDGDANELNSQRVVLRVRLYDKDKKATVTCKVGESTVMACRAPSGRHVSESEVLCMRLNDNNTATLKLGGLSNRGVQGLCPVYA